MFAFESNGKAPGGRVGDGMFMGGEKRLWDLLENHRGSQVDDDDGDGALHHGEAGVGADDTVEDAGQHVVEGGALRELALMEFGKPSLPGHQGVEGAGFHDPALFHDEDGVGLAHGRQAMGDDDDGQPMGDGFKGLLDQALGFVVQRAGRLVEEQQLGFPRSAPGPRPGAASARPKA